VNKTTGRLWLPALVIAALVVMAAGCSKSSSDTTAKTQTATVKKGNISLEVTATGNLAYAKTEERAFEMPGTVEDVLVSAGDTVEAGQELVKLDTSVWEDQIDALKEKLTTAQRNLVTAQRQLKTKDLAVRQAQLAVSTAEETMSQVPTVKAAQDLVDNAQAALKTAQTMYGSNQGYTSQQLATIHAQLAEAEQKLKEVLSGTSFSLTNSVKLQIEKAQLQVEQSQATLEDAQSGLDDAQTAVTDAEKAVKAAQDNLNETEKLSPVITASFSGFVTKVNVSGGDEVQKGTVAVQIADPTQFQADILVTEQDIYSVNLGGTAIVAVEALSGATYPATITAIAPRATVSQGVVSYSVTVEIAPKQTASQTGGSSLAQILSANGTSGWSQQTPPQTGQSQGNVLPNQTQSVTLKDGLSVTVTIVVQQASNVILVPSKAVTRQGPNNHAVKVINGSETETRTVKIGSSDGSNTEITEGLQEGEQVVYAASSSSSSNSNQQQGLSGIGGGIGGVGGPPPGGF
jgi:HlyD family secretion protein